MAKASDQEIVEHLTEIQMALRLYVQSLLPGDASAQDVAQLANTVLWKKRRQFESGTNFKAWAFSIARFEVLSYRKKQARDRLVFSNDLQNIMVEELPEEAEDLQLRHLALKTCLEKLRPQDQELIHHRYTLRTPLAEVSEQVDRSVGSIKVTLHRLRNTLQTCIEAQVKATKTLAEGGQA